MANSSTKSEHHGLQIRLVPADAERQILLLPVPTPIGRIHIAAGSEGLARVELPGTNAEWRIRVWLALHFPQATQRRGVNPILSRAAEQIKAYFTGGLTRFSLPCTLVGTDFQKSVWKEVAGVPFGVTESYRGIADSIGNRRAVRAVGAAQRMNPLPIVIPCHRIIGSDGSLTGYAGGLPLKKWLLEHEQSLLEKTADNPQGLSSLDQRPIVDQVTRWGGPGNPPSPKLRT